MDYLGKREMMAINQWRLPPELGGGVVNPVRIAGGGPATAYRVKVPGTDWTIDVPAECLAPMLPEQPPVHSVALTTRALTTWKIYQRVNGSVEDGRWSAPGGSGIVHTWRDLHVEWDTVHVVLWWDKEKVEEGAALPSGRGPHSFAIHDPTDGEPGVATVRIADGMARYAFLGQAEAIQAAAALLGLAMKERM